MSWFKSVAKEPIYGDGIGYVELWSGWNGNISEESRIETVSTIASICYGKEEAKNPKSLYKKLLDSGHNSLFEFINNGSHITLSRIGGSLRHCALKTLKKEYGKKERYVTECVEDHKRCVGTFKIKVPLFVRSQIVRHRGFSVCEMSRRYVKGDLEFWFPEDMEKEERGYFIERLADDNSDWLERYDPQIANRFLPQTLYTTMFMQASSDTLNNFFNLRLDKHAQKETRDVGEAMVKLIEEHQSSFFEWLEV